jgi:hypothetical protein
MFFLKIFQMIYGLFLEVQNGHSSRTHDSNIQITYDIIHLGYDWLRILSVFPNDNLQVILQMCVVPKNPSHVLNLGPRYLQVFVNNCFWTRVIILVAVKWIQSFQELKFIPLL